MTHASSRDLILGLEQLEVIRDLLLTGSPVKARMALILMDGLADSMLFRRLEELYEASEDPFRRRNVPRYTRQARLRARLRFNRRVEMARQKIPQWFGGDEQWLHEGEADVLRVCHSYRNLAYHEDAHNPNVIASIGRMHYAVVARLVARMQPSGLSYGSLSESHIERLASWGYETGPMLKVREAADSVTERFISELPVRSAELSELLAEDLEERVESLRSDVLFLDENTVIGAARLVEAAELSDHYSADEQLLELQDQFDLFALVESGSAEPSDEWIKRATEATVLHRERIDELERQHKHRVTLALIEQAAGTAKRLTHMSGTDATRVLVAYSAVDLPLGRLEGYVTDAVLAVDREIQQQLDIARGK